MERTELYKAKSMKRSKMQGSDGNLGTKRKHSSDNGGIDKLSDDVLIHILSRLSIKEAARASVLARRWRNLWMFAYGTVRFDQMDTAKGLLMTWKKFGSWVNKVVELHQGRFIEGMIISVHLLRGGQWASPVDNCVYFATQKEVQRLEVNLSYIDIYEFPSVERLISHSHGVTSPLCRLRTLRLANVNIEEDAFHYLLTSCANLEEICIEAPHVPENLRVIDPPSMRILELRRCYQIKSLEISATNLVSLTYDGSKNSLLLKKVPVLRTLTIGGGSCVSFDLEPKEHWYSAQLEKLVLDFRFGFRGTYYASLVLPQLCSLKRLDLRVATDPWRRLLFVASLIEASPQLCELRIEIGAIPPKFVHKELKSVEVVGYIGCATGNELVSTLVKIGPSIERVVLDTEIATSPLEET